MMNKLMVICEKKYFKEKKYLYSDMFNPAACVYLKL